MVSTTPPGRGGGHPSGLPQGATVPAAGAEAMVGLARQACAPNAAAPVAIPQREACARLTRPFAGSIEVRRRAALVSIAGSMASVGALPGEEGR